MFEPIMPWFLEKTKNTPKLNIGSAPKTRNFCNRSGNLILNQFKSRENEKTQIFDIHTSLHLLGLINSCDVLTPEDENTYDLDDVKSVVTYAEGILAQCLPEYPCFS